jgi:transposase-like protein
MEEQGNEDSPRRRGRRRYPKEFRRDAAALVIDQRRTVADVARQLGVVEQTLGNWVRQERIDRGEREGLSSEERARISVAGVTGKVAQGSRGRSHASLASTTRSVGEKRGRAT